MNLNFTLIAQAIAFALFIWFTVKFIWPPLMRAIEQRQKQIADGLAAGEQGKHDLEEAGKRAHEELAKARERVGEIIGSAEKRDAQMMDEAKAAAKAEVDRILAAAKADIDQQIARAREMLREQVAALAVAGAEKILRREVNAQSHAELLGQLKKEI
jgi:F-type H+-transporting ATPase subunit b